MVFYFLIVNSQILRYRIYKNLVLLFAILILLELFYDEWWICYQIQNFQAQKKPNHKFLALGFVLLQQAMDKVIDQFRILQIYFSQAPYFRLVKFCKTFSVQILMACYDVRNSFASHCYQIIYQVVIERLLFLLSSSNIYINKITQIYMLDRNLKNVGKSRRGLRPSRNQNKKSGNLKQLHQLLIEDTDHYLNLAQKSSAAQIVMKNKESDVTLPHNSQQKPKKDNSVNFYINIDKLKNLKISSRDIPQVNNNYSSLKSQSIQANNRKSLMLRQYGKERKGPVHSSYDHAVKSLSRIYGESSQKKNLYQKGQMRYKTHLDQKQQLIKSTSQHKSYLLKRSNFKKSTQNQFKDKTFIDGYLKGKQLGRGGFSKVWEGFHFQTKIFYAIKEIDTQNKYQTHLTEIWFGNFFFQNGKPKEQFHHHPGVHNLLTMYTYSIVDPRAFIVYQSCDGSLGNMLYDIYEEEGKEDQDEDNRLYMIKYKKLYNQLRKSTHFLRTFIIEIAQALDLLAQNKIVHSDIKTENILLKHQDKCFKFKLIDYGSSFLFQSLKQYKLATPEYMCPQLLNYILFQNKKQHYAYMLEYVKDYSNISAIDVWGLGSIVLQLINGLPLWLTNPTKIMIQGKYETKRGLFAVSDRSFSKILQRQLYIVENLQYFLQKNNNSGIMIDDQIKKVLKGMLNPNPINRMKPFQIINELMNN